MPICGAAMPMPLAKRGGLADLFYRGEQFVGDALGFVALGGQGEGAGRFGKDAGAVLDDSEVAHLLVGPCIGHLNSSASYRVWTWHGVAPLGGTELGERVSPRSWSVRDSRPVHARSTARTARRIRVCTA